MMAVTGAGMGRAMSMQLTRQLARERRARLGAERLLCQRQTDLRAEAFRLERHAQGLSQTIILRRAEMAGLQARIDSLGAEAAGAQQLVETARQSAARSDARLWSALQAIRDGFALFDAQHRLVMANAAYLSIFQGIKAVRPGISYNDLCTILAQEGLVDIKQGTPAAWIAAMQARWASRPVEPRTICLFNGEFVKLIDRPTPDGGMVTLGVNQTDILRIRAAAEILPDGFILFDREDRLVMCNDKYKRMFPLLAPVVKPGVTYTEILRHGLSQGLYIDAIGREEAWLEQQMARHRDAAGGTSETPLTDGRWVRLQESETPDGGRVGLRIDISADKRQQADLDRARVAAEAASRAKSTFLANMSHELRTPMSGVLGMAELLMDTPLNDDQTGAVEAIRGSAQALLVILDDILDFSKVEAGRLRLRPAPFDLERLVHETLLLMAPQAQAKAVDLVVDYDMFLPTGFIGDAGRLRQVLINLVGNAVKFTPAGHVMIRVTGRPEGDGTQVTVTVEDTGIGIPDSQSEHIFGEFNQVEDGTDRIFMGTGLGLAISRRLMRLMGGDIWVETDLPQGACFGMSLTLPADPQGDEVPSRLPDPVPPVYLIGPPGIARQILQRQLTRLGGTVTACDTVPDRPVPGDIQQAGVALIAQSVLSTDPKALAAQLTSLGAARITVLRSGPGLLALPLPPGVTVLQQPLRRRKLIDIISVAADPLRPDPQVSTDVCPVVRPVMADMQTPHAAVTPLIGADNLRPPLRVLAAEDNRTNQLVLTKMLASQPIELTMVGDGAAAVAAYIAARPDLILMDISMPGMDGKAATREIRRIEARTGAPRVPIVAMTAHAMAGDAETILAAGVDHYMTKPLSKAALIARIIAIIHSMDEAMPGNVNLR